MMRPILEPVSRRSGNASRHDRAMCLAILPSGQWQKRSICRFSEKRASGVQIDVVLLMDDRLVRIPRMHIHALDRLHARLVSSRLLVVFTAITRVLLALAFLPSGLTKVLGHRFTTLPLTDPVGYFFDGFFSAEGYYRFVGFAQLAAALLLLLPWTATLGALLYLPIIVNIFVITVSVNFGGTVVVAAMMLLANMYLLCWDYDRWKDLLPRRVGDRQLGLLSTLGLGISATSSFSGVVQLHMARLRHQDMTTPALLVTAAAVVALVIVWINLSARPGSPRR
jgi:hypothetical protein